MSRTIPYIAFFCLSGFTAISGLPMLAGGCSNPVNENIQIDCDKNDSECQIDNSTNYELKKAIRS